LPPGGCQNRTTEIMEKIITINELKDIVFSHPLRSLSLDVSLFLFYFSSDIVEVRIIQSFPDHYQSTKGNTSMASEEYLIF
jgi:hypothetical protein